MSANSPCEQRLYLSRNLWKLERERGGREGGAAGARGDTGRIVPLSDSPFSLICSRSSYRKPDSTKKKNLCRFLLLCLSNFSFSLHPLFHSPSILVFFIYFILLKTPFPLTITALMSDVCNENHLLGP